MKRIAIFFTALALLATGCNKGQKFTLEGDLESAKFSLLTDSLLLKSDALPTQITIHLKDGKFSYTGRVDKTAAATLKGVGGPIVTKRVILEKGTITFQDGLPCGTILNDAYAELSRSLQAIAKENVGNPEAVYSASADVLRTYLSEHGKDQSAVAALMTGRRYVKPEVLSELIEMTSPAIQIEGDIHWMKKQLNDQKKKQKAQAE